MVTFNLGNTVRNPNYDPNSVSSDFRIPTEVAQSTASVLNPVDRRIESAAGKTSLSDRIKRSAGNAFSSMLTAANPGLGALYQTGSTLNQLNESTRRQQNTQTPTTQTTTRTQPGQTGADVAPSTPNTPTSTGRTSAISAPQQSAPGTPSYDPSVTGEAVDPNRLSPDELKDLATRAGQAGLSLSEYTDLVNTNAGLTSADSDAIRDDLGIEAATDAAFKAPEEKLEDVYQRLYNNVGLKDLKEEIASIDERINQKREDFTKVEGDIKNNPWLSSASRRGRLKNAAELALNDIGNDIDARQQALDLYDKGVSQIESQLGFIISDRNLQRELDTNELNYLLSEAERREGLAVQDRSLEGLRNVPDFLDARRNEQLRIEAQEDIGSGAVEVPVLRLDEDGNVVQGTPPPKPATQGERSTFTFYQRMANAVNNLEAQDETAADLSFLGSLNLNYGNSLTQGAELEQISQAQREFTEARLRKDSGAAIPPEEFENDRKTYFPQPGDSPEVLAQKRQSRETALNALRVASGNAYHELYGVSPVDETIARLQGTGGGATGGSGQPTQADIDYAASLNLER